MFQYRFFSDSNQAGFQRDLEARGVRFRVNRYIVITDTESDALALQWSGMKLK